MRRAGGIALILLLLGVAFGLGLFLQIRRWRKQAAIEKTRRLRPDLLGE